MTIMSHFMNKRPTFTFNIIFGAFIDVEFNFYKLFLSFFFMWQFLVLHIF